MRVMSLARLSIDGSCTNALFGTPETQITSKSGDATDLREEAQDVPTMDDLAETFVV
jgi:hypothetical protein